MLHPHLYSRLVNQNDGYLLLKSACLPVQLEDTKTVHTAREVVLTAPHMAWKGRPEASGDGLPPSVTTLI